MTRDSCTICESVNNMGAYCAHIGDKRVTVCKKCADAIKGIREENVTNAAYTKFVNEIIGVREIVINDSRKNGSEFCLSYKGQVLYCEKTLTPYQIRHRPDRHSQDKYGPYVEVRGNVYWWVSIERDDPALVSVVKELGPDANGEESKLKVVKIPADVDWVLEYVGGDEWISEKHRIWY